MFVGKSKKQTAAAEFEGLIEKAEAQAAQLQTQFDQAEAAAVAVADDEDAYPEAAARAGSIRAQLAEQTERLARLHKSHANTWAAEQAEYLKRLRARLADAKAKQLADTKASYDRDRESERQLKEALETEQRERNRLAGACGPLEGELRNAESGVCERDCKRIIALEGEIKGIRREAAEPEARCSALSVQVCNKRGMIVSVGFTNNADRAAAVAELEQVTARWKQAESEVKGFRQSIEALKGEIEQVKARSRSDLFQAAISA